MIQLHPTHCALCGTAGQAQELYAANVNLADFQPELFSARRLPDRIHDRMVTCDTCGLVRSDPVADSATLGALYRQSTFEYGAHNVTACQRDGWVNAARSSIWNILSFSLLLRYLAWFKRSRLPCGRRAVSGTATRCTMLPGCCRCRRP
jgi:hypothetical protein